MFGLTAELDAEIAAMETAGVHSFISPPVGYSECWRMINVAARKRTIDGGGDFGNPIVVTVIALQGADVPFCDEWTMFGFAVALLKTGLVRNELPGFRDLKTV